MQLQTIKNDFVRENLEEKAKVTVTEMVKLLAQSGQLKPETVDLLISSGDLEPQVKKEIGLYGSNKTPVIQPKTVDEVNPPVLPEPKKSSSSIVFPCQEFTR